MASLGHNELRGVAIRHGYFSKEMHFFFQIFCTAFQHIEKIFSLPRLAKLCIFFSAYVEYGSKLFKSACPSGSFICLGLRARGYVEPCTGSLIWLPRCWIPTCFAFRWAHNRPRRQSIGSLWVNLAISRSKYMHNHHKLLMPWSGRSLLR